jgi:hypothetical protein
MPLETARAYLGKFGLSGELATKAIKFLSVGLRHWKPMLKPPGCSARNRNMTRCCQVLDWCKLKPVLQAPGSSALA